MSNPIGLRTIKTGLAVGLSVIVSQFLNLQFPFFVCMTSIFTMDKTALTSLHMGKVRVLGTLLGAIIGTLFASIDRFNPLLCAIGIILLITILNYFKLSQAIGIAGIVFCACMVHIDSSQITPFFYGLHRTLDSFIGMLVSLAVNLLILPNYDISKIQKQLDDVKAKLADFFNKESSADIHLNQSIELNTLVQQLRQQITLYDGERLSQKKRADLEKSKAQFSLLEQLVFELNVIESVTQNKHNEIIQFHYARALSHYQALQSY